MKKKTNKGLIVFIIILLLIALGVALAIFDNQREKNKDYSNNGNPNGSSLHYANEAKKIMKNKKYKLYFSRELLPPKKITCIFLFLFIKISYGFTGAPISEASASF